MSNIHKTILSLCDYSGNWSKPYLENGYNVIRIDLKHGEDVRLIPYQGDVYGVLCAPPCTYFANSGNRWKRTEDELIEGLSVVDACLRQIAISNPKFWALENPVGKLKKYLGEPAFRFDPCDFGDPYTKKTCLWGKFIPPLPLFLGELKTVEPIEGSKMYTKYGGRSERTKELRSVTPLGFSYAFFEANR